MGISVLFFMFEGQQNSLISDSRCLRNLCNTYIWALFFVSTLKILMSYSYFEGNSFESQPINLEDNNPPLKHILCETYS